MNYLAFDLGASSGKMFLSHFDGGRLTIEVVHRFPNSPIALGNGLYWDFIGIYRTMCEGIAKADSATGHQITSYGVDSYCNDFAFINRHGALLSPIRCYRDERTARCRDAIFQKMPPEKLYQRSGNQIALFTAAMQLASMREEGDDALMDSAHKMLFLPDLLHFYLTGNAINEYTIASVSQMYDYQTSDWSDEILSCFDIPRNLFAPIVQPGTCIGKASLLKDWDVSPFEVIAVCEHDTASAYLAAMHQGPGAIISSGTWMLVGTETDKPLINDYGYRGNIANEGGYPGHHRLLCNVMGNWLVQQLRREYAQANQSYSFAELIFLATSTQPLRWQVNVDDECFFSPGDVRSKIRSHCLARYGSAPENPGEFARCIIESLAFKCFYTVQKLERLVGRSLPVISVVGGGSQDQLVCQLIADVSGRLVLAGPEEASALGNVLVQMISMGDLASLGEGKELLRLSFAPRTHEPQPHGGLLDAYQDYLTHYGLPL